MGELGRGSDPRRLALVAVVGALVAVTAPVAAEAAAAPVAVIDELHYHPLDEGAEFLELHNPGPGPLDLGGACFTAGITGCFSAGASLAAGGFAVVATEPAAYAAAFPAAPPPLLDAEGALSNGGERITLTGADGTTVLDTVAYDDADPWPLSPDGGGPSLELADPEVDNDRPDPWLPSDPAPTPGAANSRLGDGPGPQLADLAIGAVAAGAPVPIAVTATGAASVAAEVTVGFGDPVEVALVDDGAHGDGAAGDGRYGGVLAAQPAGTLVRYRAVAASASGGSALPAIGAPRPRLGYVVERPTVASPLPVVDWYVADADYDRLVANKDTNDYVPAVIAYGGEVWDGAQVRVHGQSRPLPKLAFKVKMPAGAPLVAPGLATVPVDEFVLDDDSRDTFGATAPLALSVYADGNPLVAQMAKVHLERNGQPMGVYTFVEEADRSWRERVGLADPGDLVFEPEGDIGTFVDEGSPDALRPRFEQTDGGPDAYAELYELVQAIDAPPTPERAARLRDLLDVPALVDFLAVGAIVQHYDSTVHNFVLVRDASTRRWRFVPVDLDFTLGQPLPLGQSNPRGLRVPALFPYGPADLVSALRADPVASAQVDRRIRTLADRYLVGGELVARADEWASLVEDEVRADRQRWGLAYTVEQGQAQLADYLEYRQRSLLEERTGPGEIPPAADPALAPVASEAAPGPGGGFVELRNPHATSIDLTGWAIAGAATAALPPGTVLVPGGVLVVPADPLAIGAAVPPGTLLAGRLAAVPVEGGTVELRDPSGTVRSTAPVTAAGSASPGVVDAPAPTGLRVEAAADQVESLAPQAEGVGLTVVVANRGPGTVTGVVLQATSSICGRSIGTLRPGESITVRCAVNEDEVNDRVVVATATADGGASAVADPVRVRALTFRTNVDAGSLPAQPTLTGVELGDGGAIELAWSRPPLPQEATPLRWAVLTGVPRGRAVATAGELVAPDGAATTTAFAPDVPVAIAVASRSSAGTGARSAPTPPITPRADASWPASSSGALVDRWYRELEGRPATAGELALWAAAVEGGAPIEQVVLDRLSRPRWSADVAPLVRLYAAYFRRPPDASGLDYWVRQRRAGTTLTVASARFAGTSEFARTYGALTDDQFVSLVYRNVLGRDFDAAGKAYWVGRLRAGWSRGRVMTSFSESSEGRRVLEPQVAPVLIHLGLLGRPPTRTEAALGADLLRAGGPAAALVASVRSSDEYGA